MCSTKEKLNCIIRNVGLLYSSAHQRWLLPLELFTAMGFPITPEHVKAAGLPCIFSRCSQIPVTRSHRSMTQACGNGIHVNCIGALLMLIIFFLPGLCEDAAKLVHDPVLLTAMVRMRKSLKRKSNSDQ